MTLITRNMRDEASMSKSVFPKPVNYMKEIKAWNEATEPARFFERKAWGKENENKSITCPKCSTISPEGSIFCSRCGKKLIKQEKKARTKNRSNGTGMAYRRGNTWTARVTIGFIIQDGKKIQKYRTKGGFPTKAAAENYCAELKDNPRAPKSTESFSQIYDRWLAEYQERVAPTTLSSYKAAWKKFKKLHPLPIVGITVSMLQECIDECDKGRSTLDDMRTVCSLVYQYAVINKVVDQNLAQFLYVSTKKKGTRQPFSMDELKKIGQAVGRIPYADYVYCMCYLGFRPNEMLSLKKDAYDKEHNCLIGGFKTEAGTNRIVPISPKIQKIIDERLKAPGKYIFPRSDGTLMDDEHFRKYCFTPLMEQLGISGKVPYSCRHTFANLLKNVQGSDTDKAALIGHSDASMTKYYQSADYESLKTIVCAL